jgi:hypothetical protein
MLKTTSKRVIRNVTKVNTSRRPVGYEGRTAIHAWIDTGLRVIVNKPGDECHRQSGMVMATYADGGEIDVLLDRGNFRTVHANCIIPEMVEA